MKPKPTVPLVAVLAVLFGPIANSGAVLTSEQIAGLDLGINTNYAFVDIGNTTLGWNSGPIAGSVLFGGESNLLQLDVNMSGGNNGGLTGVGSTLYYDSTTTDLGGALQNPPPTATVPTSTITSAKTSAQNVSTYASGLTPTQTFGALTGTQTFTGNGALNVINATSMQNVALTLSGTANDYFVLNISSFVNTNQAMTLTGGVLPSHILWNLTGSTGNVFQTSGGNVMYGTFLATNGGDYQFSSLNLNGALINVGGDVQFVSGSTIPTFTPFNVVPEPASVALVAFGGMVLVFCSKFARRKNLPAS